MKGYAVRLHRATWTNPPREPRTDGPNPFLSAIISCQTCGPPSAAVT